MRKKEEGFQTNSRQDISVTFPLKAAKETEV